MIRILVALGSFLVIASPVVAQPRDPSEVITRHASTTEGKAVLIRNYASWRQDCTSRGEPTVSVDTQPQHGVVSVKPGMSTIREYIGNGSACVGRQVPGLSVWYQPAPGFQGTDQFGVTINTGHVFRDLMVVEVR